MKWPLQTIRLHHLWEGTHYFLVPPHWTVYRRKDRMVCLTQSLLKVRERSTILESLSISVYLVHDSSWWLKMKEISGYRNLRKVERKGSIKACFCPLETHLRITIHVPLWPLIAKEHRYVKVDLSPSKWLAENRRLFIFYFEGGTYFSYHWSFPGLLKFLALLCWGIS